MMYGFARLKAWLQIIAAAQAAESEVRYEKRINRACIYH